MDKLRGEDIIDDCAGHEEGQLVTSIRHVQGQVVEGL